MVAPPPSTGSTPPPSERPSERPGDFGDDAPPRPRRERGTTLVIGAYIAVLCGYIVWTSAVVVPQIFGAAPTAPISAPCYAELRSRADALSRAHQAALRAPSEEVAISRYRAALSPEWAAGEAPASCTTRGDLVAAAGLSRQRRVEEGWVRRAVRETLPAARALWPDERPPERGNPR